jgi:hypothetical protein
MAPFFLTSGLERLQRAGRGVAAAGSCDRSLEK